MSACMRLIRVIPPDAITFEQAKAAIEKDVFDRKLSPGNCRKCLQIRAAANPLLTQHVRRAARRAQGVAPAPARQHPDPKVLAVMYGNVPVTREDSASSSSPAAGTRSSSCS